MTEYDLNRVGVTVAFVFGMAVPFAAMAAGGAVASLMSNQPPELLGAVGAFFGFAIKMGSDGVVDRIHEKYKSGEWTRWRADE